MVGRGIKNYREREGKEQRVTLSGYLYILDVARCPYVRP